MHGLTVQADYTWSKNLTDLDAHSSANRNNPADLAQQYGPAGFNRPQRLVLSYRWELPFGGAMGGAGRMLKGWSISGNTIVQNGTPLTLTDAGGGTAFGLTFDGAGTNRAQLCPGVSYRQRLYHPQFGNPGLDRNTPTTFGVISDTATNPRLIQFAVKYSF